MTNFTKTELRLRPLGGQNPGTLGPLNVLIWKVFLFQGCPLTLPPTIPQQGRIELTPRVQCTPALRQLTCSPHLDVVGLRLYEDHHHMKTCKVKASIQVRVSYRGGGVGPGIPPPPPPPPPPGEVPPPPPPENRRQYYKLNIKLVVHAAV